MQDGVYLNNTNIMLQPVMMGTWQADVKRWPAFREVDFIQALERAYHDGIRCFDTAEVYANGYAEQLLAKALNSKRAELVIASKVFANHLHADAVITACERSLQNLQTDYIDLYQVHWPPGSFGMKCVPMEETFAALNQLKQAGKIRAIGVSNFSQAELTEALQYADIVSNQVPYSLYWRHIDKSTRSFCQRHNIAILAYSALAQGLLSGKIQPGFQLNPEDNRQANSLFQPESLQRAFIANAQLQKIAQAKSIPLSTLAIAWVCHQHNTVAIVGARTAEQSALNAQAINVCLTQDEVAMMSDTAEEVFTPFVDVPNMWQQAFQKKV